MTNKWAVDLLVDALMDNESEDSGCWWETHPSEAMRRRHYASLVRVVLDALDNG